jgi:hypothetical protein
MLEASPQPETLQLIHRGINLQVKNQAIAHLSEARFPAKSSGQIRNTHTLRLAEKFSLRYLVTCMATCKGDSW